MAVVFAMLTSYLLTRTLVPTMVHYMLRPEVEIYQQGEEGHRQRAKASSGRRTTRSIAASRAARTLPKELSTGACDHRGLVARIFGVFCRSAR